MNKNTSNSKPVQITYKTYQGDRSKSQPTPNKSTAQPPKRKP